MGAIEDLVATSCNYLYHSRPSGNWWFVPSHLRSGRSKKEILYNIITKYSIWTLNINGTVVLREIGPSFLHLQILQTSKNWRKSGANLPYQGKIFQSGRGSALYVLPHHHWHFNLAKEFDIFHSTFSQRGWTVRYPCAATLLRWHQHQYIHVFNVEPLASILHCNVNGFGLFCSDLINFVHAMNVNFHFYDC